LVDFGENIGQLLIVHFCRAIAESIALQSGHPPVCEQIPEYTPQEEQNDTSGSVSIDEQLRLALVLSQQQNQEDEQRRRQEEEELDRILQLSLQEK